MDVENGDLGVIEGIASSTGHVEPGGIGDGDPTMTRRLDRSLRSQGLQLLTIPAAADRLAVSRSKLYELIADGQLPTVRIGRARRVAVRDLVVFVAERRGLG